MSVSAISSLERLSIAPLSKKNPVHEYNTEQGATNSEKSTYHIVSALLSEREVGAFDSIEDRESKGKANAFVGYNDAVHLLNQLKQSATDGAEACVKRVISHANKVGATDFRPSLAKQMCMILNQKNFRRQETLTESEIELRAQKLRGTLNLQGDPKLSILAFPARDANPAKNDGVLPDLGEASSLVRFWSIAHAFNSVRKSEQALLSEVLSEAGSISIKPTSVFTNGDISNASTFEKLVGMIRSDPTIKRKRVFIDKLDKIKDYISTATVHDFDNFYKIVKASVARNVHPRSLIEADQVGYKDIKMNIIRDPSRYPCYASEKDSDHKAYADSLNEISNLLGLHHELDMESLDEKIDKLPEEARKKYEADMHALYEEFGFCRNNEREAVKSA